MSRFDLVIEKAFPESKLVNWWQLEGGSSADVSALELILSDGSLKRVVIRQYADRDLVSNPGVAGNEFRLLETLSEGVSVPEPYFVDESCTILSRPYTVMEYIEGKTEFRPDNLDDYLCKLAKELVKIHSVDTVSLSFLPEVQLKGINSPVLLHGDFWPGNVLWKEEELVGVIDWEDAMIGDPLYDLSNARLELMWVFGFDAMEMFTAKYLAMRAIDMGTLADWDIYVATKKDLSKWGLDLALEKRMREDLKVFISYERGKVDG